MSGFWERNPIDVLIAIPVSGQDNVYYEWHESSINMLMNIPQGLKVVPARLPEPCIDVVRDKAVALAKQYGARWLFFLDSDILPPPDTLKRLLKHNLPIVGGLYVRRHNPPFNEMLWLRKDGVPGLNPIKDGEYKDGELVECDAIGTGCLLINTEVFEKMRPFQMTIDNIQCRPQYFLWTEHRLNPGFSEDFSWCIRARESGFKIFCDTSIKCKHLGPVKFIPSGNNSLNIEFVGS